MRVEVLSTTRVVDIYVVTRILALVKILASKVRCGAKSSTHRGGDKTVFASSISQFGETPIRVCTIRGNAKEICYSYFTNVRRFPIVDDDVDESIRVSIVHQSF